MLAPPKPFVTGLMADVIFLLGPSTVQLVVFLSSGCQCLRVLRQDLIEWKPKVC